MCCGKSKERRAAARPQSEAHGRGGRGRDSSAKVHPPSPPLPEHPATGASGPSRSTSARVLDPRARLIRACIDSHPVVLLSKSTCERCAEVKKLFKSMCVPYFLLELDQAVSLTVQKPLWVKLLKFSMNQTRKYRQMVLVYIIVFATILIIKENGRFT